MHRTTRTIRMLAVAVAAAIVVTACAAQNDPDAQGDGGGTGTTGPSAADEQLTGTIAISGSSTVEPISARNAQAFREEHPAVNISVNGPGTGDGFQLFCAGETDVSDASRPIRPPEQETCAANGIEYVELRIGIDGLSVLTNPANDQVGACLSFADLYALVGPESERFSRWSDADDLAAELDGTVAAPYPDAPLEITGPGEESGTYDTFVELVVEDLAEQRGHEAATRPDYSASPNDNVIVQGIQGSATSLGWVGYAFYVENRDQLRAFEVAGDDGNCVAPTDETIAAGDYPLSRPLFIYVNTARAAQRPALEAFVDFYLSEEGRRGVVEAGYVALDDTAYTRTLQAWLDR